MLDPATCYKALKTRDARFDGRLFVAVTSTGIYCRPVCPARPPKPENCRFFPSAAAAQEAGFRPCLRCRPETAPELGSWRGTSNTVSRGLTLIAEGELDGESASVDELAERLGVGGRQLRRLFKEHLGASPVAVAQTRRVLLAKQLIHDTELPMAEIAFAAGFGSVRRFNETFRQLFRRAPSELRGSRRASLPETSAAIGGVTVRLRYRPPYDWAGMLTHLEHRAVEGVERVEDGSYVRSVLVDGEVGSVAIRHEPATRSLAATTRVANVSVLPAIVARIRRAFDLGADVGGITAELGKDPWLEPLVAARPGLRIPGAWDRFELGVRAVLGQQVSVQAARRLAGRLVELCGTAATTGAGNPYGLRFAFPTPAQVASADLSALGMPNARRQTLYAIARAVLANPLVFHPRESIEATVANLRNISGVGDWTAHYIALRAGQEVDAFPAADRGLLRAAARSAGGDVSVRALEERAQAWRPWRSYAAQHLWVSDSAAQI
jgi:AraC family transcriptional regulator of adaptative response / DNA-3-methyladenine glycosylase II